MRELAAEGALAGHEWRSMSSPGEKDWAERTTRVAQVLVEFLVLTQVLVVRVPWHCSSGESVDLSGHR